MAKQNQGKVPQRPVYDFESVSKQTGRDKTVKRPDYTYQAPTAPTNTAPPLQNKAASPSGTSSRKPELFNQDIAPVPPKRKKMPGELQQTVLPLGTITVTETQTETQKPPPQKPPAAKKAARAQAPKAPAAKPVQNYGAHLQQPQKQKSSAKQPEKSPAHPQPTKSVPKAPRNQPLSYGEARRRRARRRAMATIAVFAICVCGVVFSYNALFKIQSIAVVGEIPYETQTVLDAFVPKKGDGLYSFDAEEQTAALQLALPYLESVTLRRRIPDKLELQCKAAVERYVVNTSSGWVVLSETLRVLRYCDEIPQELTLLLGVETETVALGMEMLFTDGEKQASLRTIAEGLAAQGIEQVTEIDLTNTLELSFLYQDRVRIVLGTANDVESKVDFVQYLLENHDGEGIALEERGTLDVSNRNAEGRLQAVWSEGKL